MITQVSDSLPESADPASVERLSGLVLPGVPNLHSHAFQRALAGLTERADRRQSDSFWTWRVQMYALALSLSPDDLEAIAAQLYVEMLEAGMTAVGEFHYLHHGQSGDPYAAPEEMSLRIIEASKRAKIALTHLPVLYRRGGFQKPPQSQQRRFIHHSTEDYLRLWQRLHALVSDPDHARVRLGAAPHSLRAVTPEDLTELVSGLNAHDPRAPIHIHIAEQPQEVEDCVAHLGARPVRWLLSNQPVDARWCLVHATHLQTEEVHEVARSEAVVGLCPSTEANLGDGIFEAVEFAQVEGRFGIGSDSHVTIDPAEELRLLEYGQRLKHLRRNLLIEPRGEAPVSSVGRFLFDQAVQGGAQAMGQPIGGLVAGRFADLIRLDLQHPRLCGHEPDTALDAWIFGSAQGAVQDVMVSGAWVVREGRHLQREAIARRFRECVLALSR